MTSVPDRASPYDLGDRGRRRNDVPFRCPDDPPLAFAYGSINQLRSWNADEKLAWASLSTLEGPERPLSPQMEVFLRDGLARERFYSRLIPTASEQLWRAIIRAEIRRRLG